MKKDIKTFVRECQVFQRNKGEIVKIPWLLHPFHIPNQIWEEISMDFITCLSKLEGKDAIFVFVDRLTKYAYFYGIQSTYTPSQVAEVFMKEIHRIHGFPKVIVSDKDPNFIGKFWKELWKMSGTTLAMRSTYHP
jgi:hypothetical protein